MKIKFLLTSLFVVGLGFTSMAQSISFGPRVGFTSAKVTSDEIASGTLSGLQVGAVMNYGINEMFSVQPELLLVQKGGKLFGTKQVVNYLEVPVLAKASIDLSGFQAFFTGGPTLGYAMGGKYKDDEGTVDIEWQDEDNRFELGASFGVGLAYPLGAGALNLDVRYGLGLTALSETEDDDFKSYNRVFGVSVAYLFGK